MGRKGSWISALKKVFSGSKEKPPNGSEKKSSKEKKKSRGILKHGENRSFIPLFKEPSSIEEILGEIDNQNLFIRPPTSSELPKTQALPAGPEHTQVALPEVSSPRAASPRTASPRVDSPKGASLRVPSSRSTAPRIASPRPLSSEQNRREVKHAFRTRASPINLHGSATRIQAAYRGYLARRSFRALRGLVRLQGVIRGQNVQRQTMNAMKHMQLLVRIQTQIQSRRVQMLENQALPHHSYRNGSEASEPGNSEDWDDSLLTKEEIEERLQKKVEAVIKRERAMAYAYSHQLRKAYPKSAQATLDFRSNGFPWWWNWMESQMSTANHSEHRASAKNVQLTPSRPIWQQKPSPRHPASNSRIQNSASSNHDSGTPRSSKSTIPTRPKPFHTPTRTPSRTPPPNSSGPMRFTRITPKAAGSTFDVPMNDADSLTSCPPFSAPSYMAPTVSAKAKVRANSNPKERLPGTPGSDSKRRFSFPLTPNIGSFKWNKGSNQDSASHKVLQRHESMRSIGEVSLDSAVSMPTTVGRKPFNRFV